VTILGILWGGGLDKLALLVFALSVLSIVAGVYDEMRPRHEEHLERTMFPKE
jgi:hypothetical protein